MTTKLSLQYLRSTATTNPEVQLSIYVSTYTYFKMFFFSLIGRPQLLWHTLSDAEVDAISKMLVRWRVVKKIRGRFSRLATAPVLKTGER